MTGRRDVHGLRPGRFFLTAWALLALAGVLWAVGTPLFSAADENSHVVKAAAVAHGQWTGEDRLTPPGSYHNFLTYVELPAYFEQSGAVPSCFKSDRAQDAGCAPAFDADETAPTEVPTSAGRYGPLPYLVSGWPSLLWDGEVMVYLMRVSSAVVCGALLALGLTSLRASAGGPVAALGALVATTPMALAFAGAVNPSGLEAASAVAFAACLLPVALGDAPRQTPWRLAGAALSGALLVNVRPSSPLVVLFVGLVALAVARRDVLRRLWRTAMARVFVVVDVLAAAAAAAWTLTVRPLESLGGTPEPAYAVTAVAVRDSLFRTERYLREVIGVTGWLDTPVPFLTVAVWVSLLSALCLLALVLARPRQRLVLVGTAVVLVVLPTALQVRDAAQLGLIFQGRYLLPFFVVLPVLSALVVARAGVLPWRTASRGAMYGACTAHLAGLLWAVRRYALGEGGEIFSLGPPWQPPGGVDVFLAVAVGVSLAAAVAWTVSTRGAPDDLDAPGTAGGTPRTTRGQEASSSGVLSG